MSLDCKLLRKEGEDQIYYYCRNSGITPTEINLWTNSTEIPKEIEHYFKNLDIITIGPNMAEYLGIRDRLYPNLYLSKCCHPACWDTICIGKLCIFAPDGNWEKCPHFKHEPERNLNL